jgi:phosphoglycolate phosphatase-like HAD superfamily hydrolase
VTRVRAVIFDVDGVLLELTPAEEDLFFDAFKPWCDPATLSRDWDSYRIRNDDNIVDELMDRFHIVPEEKPRIIADYLRRLGGCIYAGTIACPAVAGAGELLSALAGRAKLGIATANFREAARLRLAHVDLWEPVKSLAFGADSGGAKHEILARAIRASGLPSDQIIYVGDNRNDVEAGLRNGLFFIGFSEDPARRALLAKAGATCITATHAATLAEINKHLAA